jgi:amidase
MRGHGMSDNAAPSDILVGGPLARSAADLELALDLIAGPDEAEGPGWQLALPQEPRDGARGWRIAIVADDPEFRVDASIRGSLLQLGEALESQGAMIDREPTLPISSRLGYELFITLLRGATSARFSLDEIAGLGAKARGFPESDRSYDALMHRGLTISHAGWLAADDRRQALRYGWREFFARYDALICPVTTTPAFPHMIGVPKIEQLLDVDGVKRPASDNYYWIGIPSLSYLPATAIPIGATAAGLPVGAQIIGPELGDKRCLRLARIIEATFRGFVPPPRFVVT